MLKTIMKDLLMGSVNDTENNGNFGLNCDSGGNESLDELLSGYLEFSDVVCKSNCFTSLSKLVKLTKGLKELNEKLQAQVGKSFCQFRNSRIVQRPQKRPSADNSCSPSRKRLRKECANTPTRKFLNSTVVDSGSSMAVCILYSYQ